MTAPGTDVRAAALARLLLSREAPIGPMVPALNLPRVDADVAFVPGRGGVLLPSASPLLAALRSLDQDRAVLPPGRLAAELGGCVSGPDGLGGSDGPGGVCFPARGGRWTCPRCGRLTPVPTAAVGLRLTACGCADAVCLHPVGGSPARPR